jgi:hypothetical protein
MQSCLSGSFSLRVQCNQAVFAMQGTFTGVLSNKSSPIKTTSAGNFSVASDVKLALYNFTNDGFCKDLLSDAPVW